LTLQELLELRRTQGQEAADKALKTLSSEQMRDILVETNKAIINLANLSIATYIDYAVDANLDISQKPKQEVNSLIQKVKELK
jgi:hypothetical protein